MIWLGIVIGWVLGALGMWVYFAHYSGLHRTRGEFHLARGIGDGAINLLCESIRRDTIKGMDRALCSEHGEFSPTEDPDGCPECVADRRWDESMETEEGGRYG